MESHAVGLVCACLITAVFAAGDMPDVRGGFLSSGHCSRGTFSYQGHKVILKSGGTTFVMTIPRLTMQTSLSYCLMDDKAQLGAFTIPVYIYSEKVIS